jgi:hypothetical protein
MHQRQRLRRLQHAAEVTPAPLAQTDETKEVTATETALRRGALVVVLAVAATTAATLLVVRQHERDAALEQVLAEHEELMRHMSQMEQMLSASLHRDRAVAPGQPQRSAGAPSAPAGRSAESATAEQREAHEERVRAGNSFVDNAIASGVWNPSDFGDFVIATRNLSAEERGKMLERLTIAINTDRVRLDLTRRLPE